MGKFTDDQNDICLFFFSFFLTTSLNNDKSSSLSLLPADILSLQAARRPCTFSGCGPSLATGRDVRDKG